MTVTVITGATGKIGQSLVRDRLARGDTVMALGRREDSVAAFKAQHVEAMEGRRLYCLALDLIQSSAAQSVVEYCAQQGLLPDNLINNARSLAFMRTDDNGLVRRADFVGELTLDVVAAYELVMALAHAPQSRLKQVVNVGSQYGVVAPNLALYEDGAQPVPIHYGVAKAALVHLSREMAVRLAPRVRVNCVSFGGVEGRADGELRGRYARLSPSGRMLRDSEVAGPVDFLLSDASSGMTGHNLVVDGGWTIW